MQQLPGLTPLVISPQDTTVSLSQARAYLQESLLKYTRAK